MKEFPHREEINKFLKNNPTPVVLTDPFMSQWKLIDHTSLHGPYSSMEEIRVMSAKNVGLATRTQTYDKPFKKKDEGTSSNKNPSTSPSPPLPSNNPLTIKKPSLDTNLGPPMSTI